MKKALPTENDYIRHVHVDSVYGSQPVAMIKRRVDPRGDLAIDLAHSIIRAHGAPVCTEVMRQSIVNDACDIAAKLYEEFEERGWVLDVPDATPDPETMSGLN